MMEVTLTHVPQTEEKKIELEWRHLSKETIEVVIAELYRNDSITFDEAQNLLSCSSWQETSYILEQHGCELYYDSDDFKQDLQTINLIKERNTR